MIHFFRKIRHQFLSENKVRKYLLYAIGEIILVVVGILIALQINNWNEQQKLKSKEYDILLEIKSELSDAVEDIKDDVEDRERNIRSAVIVANSILHKQPFHDTLRYHYMIAWDIENLTVRQSGFEALENIGLEIISNDSIRLIISNIYLALRENIRAVDRGQEDRLTIKLGELLEPHLMIDHRITLIRPEGRQTFFGGQRRLPFQFTDYDNFLRDEQFLYALVRSIEQRAVRNRRYKRFQNRLDRAIDKIEEELHILDKR